MSATMHKDNNYFMLKSEKCTYKIICPYYLDIDKHDTVINAIGSEEDPEFINTFKSKVVNLKGKYSFSQYFKDNQDNIFEKISNTKKGIATSCLILYSVIESYSKYAYTTGAHLKVCHPYLNEIYNADSVIDFLSNNFNNFRKFCDTLGKKRIDIIGESIMDNTEVDLEHQETKDDEEDVMTNIMKSMSPNQSKPLSIPFSTNGEYNVYDAKDTTSDGTNNNIKSDKMVNHPSHYADGKYECIDVMEDCLDRKHFSPFEGLLWGNAFKYIFRCGLKHSDSSDTHSDIEKTIQDLKKSEWYIERLISTLEKEKK
jgi:hypothetical protein